MIRLPPPLQNFQSAAERCLKQHLVKDTEFSGPTYQVLVQDPKKSELYWVFLQIGGKGQIKDGFCSCEEGHASQGCLHLAIAYLSLYGDHKMPLHQRFANSLWNRLCRLFEARQGDDAQRLTSLQSGHYVLRSSTDRILFSVKALTSKAVEKLETIIHGQARQTEETSLKFSNLTPDEIQLWKEGRPHSQLRYDLSYWSDLAKWLIQLQEEPAGYSIEFRYNKKELPNWIQVCFEELEAGFYLSESHLPCIIPSLHTVKSPLSVTNVENQGIDSITYDKHTGVMQIVPTAIKQPNPIDFFDIHHIQVGEWTYLPQEGFYADTHHPLLDTSTLEGEELSDALTAYQRLIGSLLKEIVVHTEPVPLSYRLFFDPGWNLHIQSYVFEPGDLLQGDSRLIGNWVYLDEDGFYPIENKRFEIVDYQVPTHAVGDFVTRNRAWLNGQEGFQTHVRGIEYQIGYQISSTNRLTFMRTLAKQSGEERQRDFGLWVYVKGMGFYPKSVGSFNHLLQKGFSLSEEQIPLFIRLNKQELGLISGFFSDVCPIAKASLKIESTPRAIRVIPQYELLPSYKQQKYRLFDYYVYMEGEGFSELPYELRLPEFYRTPQVFEGKAQEPFIREELDTLRPFASKIDPKLIKPTKKSLVLHHIQRAEDHGRGWYRLNLAYQTEAGLIPILAIRQAIQKRHSFLFHMAGMLDLKENEFEWIRHLPKERFEEKMVLLSTLEFMRLNAYEQMELLEAPQADQRLFEELIHLETPEEPDMGGLVSHLRPYQELGVHWLWFLYRHQLSGLLCDDMGLGKTHQAMALLVSVTNFIRAYAENAQHHFLIVCPTSVIYHWQEKLQQFLPGLRVCTFYGTKRSLEAFHEQYDILLTSFGILRNERELLSKVAFEVAIIDEIQVAKNQSSQVYAALTKINAQMKLGLTGTPIENRLRELKSLFDLVLPSYMPHEAVYRDQFIKPIEKENSSQRKAVLKRLIHPFTLRRKKEEVLKDLPEKIEEISYCDLSTQQYQYYSEVLEQRRRHLIEELQSEQNAIPFLHIFALLSSLKQICDHPAVYLKVPHEYVKYQSGKWELFLELLREARESQQKVVVFTQYLGMMDILEHYLKEQKIGFASLRGATKNRKEQLRAFNEDPNCEVFVGSLQASGLGVDLTAGSVVIHYDRWWNAARENQATDRVHRIGQKRGVQVFKLVTKGTFEEKIDKMIFRKGRLMEEVIQIDDQDLLKVFSREDLIELLSLSKNEDDEHPLLSDEGL